MSITPVFVTETDEKYWTDCSWCSALMLANEATLNKYPATRAEREALRAASGDLVGGSNLNDVDRGTKARYGFVFRRAPLTWSAFIVELAPDSGALLQGLYSRLPAHYIRWDPKFAAKGNDSAHAVYIERHRDGKLWWMDPLGRGTYKGEYIEEGIVKAYALGLGTIHASVAREGEFLQEASDVVKIDDPTPRTLDLAIGTPLYDAETGTKKLTQIYVGGNDLYSPYAVGSDYAVTVTSQSVKQIMRARKTAAKDIKPYGGGDTKHTVAVTVDGKTTWSGSV